MGDRGELCLIVLWKETCNLQCAVEHWKDHSSRGSTFSTYLCYRIAPAEGARFLLTCVTGLPQQREHVFYLPVLQDYPSRGSTVPTYLRYRITPGEGTCPAVQNRLWQRELVLRLPVSTDSLQEKESLYCSSGYTSTLASEVRSGGLGLFQWDLSQANTWRPVVVLK
ncbi:hypothetical protein EOD39_5925 [Acipenser ruthenus]|uniref:Uncharacterized protein n=1 Tax=Acipenser ruthenus TaxID=7906 RepID=A0A444UCB0_ACIRT|nr:hypothetical protein EOD39_5925 [Acipenser ruthenus]